MKKIIALLMSICVMTTMAGCGADVEKQDANISLQQTEEDVQMEPEQTDQAGEQSSDTVETKPQETDTTASGENILVVYFSRTGEQYTVGVIDKGNTAIVAEMIAEETGADTFEILPQEDYYPYTYKELTDVAKQEQNDNARPAYRGDVPDLSEYSTIFIGAPVWWGDWPMICYTFFENEDLSGKKLVPFSTHEGSGLSGFDKKLASACPDAEVLEGLAIRGNDAQNDQDSVRASVKEWLTGLGH